MYAKFVKTVQKYQMINPGEKVVVGVSGGPDSMALLFCLLKYREEVDFSLEVVHVNHGLRGRESDLDEELVLDFTRKYGINFHVKKLDDLKDLRENLQAVARQKRYEFFYEVLEKTGADKIALAHTASDVAETVMMNILRGAGTEGLCGIWPVRDRIIRPLYTVFRREVMSFVERKNIPYRVDSSNLVPKYLRNKVRLKLFPFINEEFATDIEERLFNLALIKQEENQVLDNYLNKLWQEAFVKEGQYLKVPVLQNLSRAEAGLLLRKFWEQATGSKRDLYQEHIENLLAFCNDIKGTRYFLLPRGMRAKLSYGKLFLEKNLWQPKVSFGYELIPPGSLEIPEAGKKITLTPAFNGKFDLFLAKSSGVIVRNRRPGDRFTFRGHTKKLKEWLIEQKIPRDIRDRLLIIEVNGQIAWVEGLGTGDLFKNSEDSDLIPFAVNLELLKSC
ncbi:tRNA lysidine(34) synthetase TilS [Carboxydothermus ferrireducens]|uniref:tRNA(Ile)-lysidine synthase n=1 Tax=Carboxydothermus ferrireducens DSM 11255 TaxID=1119529 RepID=A0ABX2R872_9THEO|nr:tRNA lysidine(34) synthetase TilS [Carboxydothermus ferrireducens]NYE57376.1 tRNA(Ile)-lysidine synthase [Carboxydothermus ferrireducens DSM 11255]